MPYLIHHIFTLDTLDPKSPIRFENARFVPLVYPLAYSVGGGEISYKIIGDYSIEIVELSKFRAEVDLYFELDSLPERKAELIPLTYAEQRIIESSIRNLSFWDSRRMKRVWNGECFRVAGILEYDSTLGQMPCAACGYVEAV